MISDRGIHLPIPDPSILGGISNIGINIGTTLIEPHLSVKLGSHIPLTPTGKLVRNVIVHKGDECLWLDLSQ